LALAAVIVVPSAQAACGVPISFNQGGYACSGYYCYIQSPGANDIGTLGADFWSLTTGSPALGGGDDDGSWENSGWLTRYSPTYGIYMVPGANWAATSAIDGCIDNKIPAGKVTEVMVAAFSDQGGANGFWAAAVAQRDRAASPQFNFGTFGTNIDLVAIPTPSIVGSRRIDANNIEVDISCPDLCASGGFYGDGSATCPEVVQGCQMFNQQLGLGDAGPGPRDLASGWADTGTVIANGATGTVAINCAADSSNYLGVAVAFDSGFTSQFVGGNSNRVDCGPNAADPSPRFKLIDRKGGKVTPKDR
jgi:hypothetical protein